MKKLLLIVLNMAFAFGVFAQTAEKDAAKLANPDLSAAQKATLSLVKTYDLPFFNFISVVNCAVN